MAKLEQTINGEFYEILGKIEQGIVEGSMSASLEEFSDLRAVLPDVACVSLSVIVMQEIIE